MFGHHNIKCNGNRVATFNAVATTTKSTTKKLTKNQRNQKKARKERNQAYIDKALERRHAKQYDKVQLFINLDKKETKEQNARI